MKWPEVKLEKIARISGGSTPKRNNDAFWGGDIRWATPSDLPMPGLDIANIENTQDLITDKGLKSCSASLLPEGTVIFSTRATIGKIGIAQVPLATNQGFANFTPKECTDSKYLAYCLQFFTPQITQLAGSTTFKEVSRGAIKKFRIPFPPISEQRRIVEILDQADRLRKLRAEADKKAERILPALFIKMFGDPATNPMGWDEIPIKDIVDSIEAGWSTSGETRSAQPHEFGVLKVSAVTSGKFKAFEHKAVTEIPANKKLVTPHHGDLLFSRANTRELVAATCVAEEEHSNLFLPDKLWRINLIPGRATTLFLKELFWKDVIRENFRKSASGSSGSMLNISQKDMLQTIVPVPPFELQKKFTEKAWEIIEYEKKGANASLAIYSLWKNLLHRAFTGGLTASWRQAHMKELLQEMELQAKAMNN